MLALTSFSDFLTVSSILAGWILPSTISFSSVSLAISLLIGSNPERMTASGVHQNKFNSGKTFDSADISSLSADYPSFHFIIREIDNRYS